MAKQILEVTDVRITNIPQWPPTADGALLSTLSTTGVPKLPLAPANHKLANPRLWYSSGATWDKIVAAVTKTGFPATAAMCSFRFFGALRGCVPKRTEVVLPVGKDGVPLIARGGDVNPAARGVPTVVVVAKPAVVPVEKDADEEEKCKKRKRKPDEVDEVVPDEAAAVTKKVKADEDDKEAKKRAKEAEKEAKRAEKDAKKRAKEAEKEAKRKAKEKAKTAKGK
ncbi:hypothetical protein AMAG_11665 [Allomyces macrogynus ATCC 38327]|uniref:Uncharacterized protein n=1 Tax=Allomyces macrogynus (strain ATCC 38327) TaxID=578462 RepID=A0A0L0SVY5_ALLM3|nr:hypothetical protein AMAG_11665 [Allomyces macrogynus ATCC 38327]|eukprot:KNE66535.1 hypothetical protein AMAG_11665 [Allomyces macrogynus ATCC 38327]